MTEHTPPHRGAKRPQASERCQALHDTYKKVLVVCEGEKTEPHYFQELKDHLQITTLRVSGDCGSDPVSVVKHGIALYEEEKRGTKPPFDAVFCVFDRDAHQNYQQAMDILTRKNPKNVFMAITSIPCFEYWILLHFSYTTKPYSPVGKNSAGDAVLKDVKSYWPLYNKGTYGTYKFLLDRLETAQENAIKSLKAATAGGTDNPSTHIHELVTCLQNIKTNGFSLEAGRCQVGKASPSR